MSTPLVRLTQAFAAAALVATLAACDTMPQQQSTLGLTDLTERPAERALMGAMRAYDDADYAVRRTPGQRGHEAGPAQLARHRHGP